MPNGFYTWQNKRSRTRHIASCIGKFLVLESVLIEEGELGTFVMPGVGSNHWPICLEWTRLGELVKRTFRF